jgi:hypothetical protein
MDASSAVRIERLNYLLGAAIAAVSTLLLGTHVGLGVLVGAAISAANFSVLRRLVGKMLKTQEGGEGGEGRKTTGAILFLPKMAALIVAVALAIYYLPVSPIAVAVGFSIFLVSIGVETVRFLTRESHG